MKIIRLRKIDSTQIYLQEYIRKHGYEQPLCIVTDFQTNGIGSRRNSWIGKQGNLYFSFVLEKSILPKDLPLESISIYFAFIFRIILKELGSEIWLKWPNDFYIDSKKIGGAITHSSNNLIYCGIGLNLLHIDSNYGKLDIKISTDEVLEKYFNHIKTIKTWKQIFSEFKIEFEKSKKFKTTVDNEKMLLQDAILNEDGSIQINNEKVFSLR